jgi:iron complex transport system permease protein
MKIVIDIDRLLSEGRITGEEYLRLRALSVEETGSLGFNILIGFGVIATAGGALALLPSGPTAIVVGVILSLAGLFLSTNHDRDWGLLASLLLLVGSLTAAGGILYLTGGGFFGFLIVTVVCLGAAWRSRSGLLAVIGVLSLTATLGAMTAYGHATYLLTIRQPTLTVGLFSVLGVVAYRKSKVLRSDDRRPAIMIARASLFVVNLGFWVGSLWGDSLWHQGDAWDRGAGDMIPAWVFAVGWAASLVIAGAWAVWRDKRWVVNLLAVFAAIHLYTQYFEHMGSSPASFLIAGLMALGIAMAIVRYNRSAKGALPVRKSSIGLEPDATGS